MHQQQTVETGAEVLGRYYDELELGSTFETQGRTITEADLMMFSALTGDWYPLHSDAEWAGRSVFGERIAHGMLVLSYAAGLLPLQPGPIVAFYGIDKLRFFAPTKIGDTIRVRMELKEKQDREGNMGLATFDQQILNQTDLAVARASFKVMLKRHPG